MSIQNCNSTALSIVRQDSNDSNLWGKENNIIVVKNLPFVLKFNSLKNVSNCVAEASLFYDSDENKSIIIPSGAPITCRVIPNKESVAHAVDIEFCVKVLSIHHDNSPFRVKLTLKTLTSDALTTWIRPIYCVSKPQMVEKTHAKLSQPKTPRKRGASTVIKAPPATSANTVSQISNSITPSSLPNNSGDMNEVLKGIHEYLQMINAKLDHQQHQINAITSFLCGANNTPPNNEEEERSAKVHKVDPNNNVTSSQTSDCSSWDLEFYSDDLSSMNDHSDI